MQAWRPERRKKQLEREISKKVVSVFKYLWRMQALARVKGDRKKTRAGLAK